MAALSCRSAKAGRVATQQACHKPQHRAIKQENQRGSVTHEVRKGSAQLGLSRHPQLEPKWLRR
eukprot:10106414-Prorocentrum_lima.AAC.1